MGDIWKKLSLMPTGIRRKLYASICLMVLVPLGILSIFAAFILPATREMVQSSWFFSLSPEAANSLAWLGIPAQTWSVILMLGSAAVMAVGGWLIVRGVFEPIVEMASGARKMAEGNVDLSVDIQREDELGDISDALNRLTHRARQHMEELRQYSEQTKAINSEIHQRSMAMSGILQVGNLISQSADLETILDLALKQLSMVQEGSFAFLYLTREQFGGVELKATYNLNPDVLAGIQPAPVSIIIDDQQRPTEAVRELYERLGGANVVTQPVMIREREVGLLCAGNHAIGFHFAQDYLELMTIFAKQIAIAVENDRLVREAGELAIKDELTGLYNEHYIRTRLDEEIKRAIAYQRPCAFVLFEVDEFQRYSAEHGKAEADRMLKRLAWVLLESVTEVDRVGRFGVHTFAILLPERNKRQAAELAETVRKRVSFAFGSEQDPGRRVTLSGGVSENPIDGVTAFELLAKAQGAIGDVRVRGDKNCVIA